jgi:hypothetical protein
MELPQGLKLVEPTLAEHLDHDDGFVYARVRRTKHAAAPWRDTDLLGLPFATLVHDLETDRHGVRERFAAELREHVAAGRSVVRFQHAVAAAFDDLFGGRGRSVHAMSFDSWVTTLAIARPETQRMPDAWRVDELAREVATAIERDEYCDRVVELARQLAGRDRARARELVESARGTWIDDEDLDALHDELDRYPDAAALHARLDELGFRILEAPPASAGSVIAALRAGGCGLVFDAETGHVPADHPSLLYWLADLTLELRDADFDQRAPDFDDDPDTTAPYTLRAYHAGRRWTCRADNCGDFYDVDSCIGLVNALLRDTPTRVAALGPREQTVEVIAGPAAAILALRDEGLIELQ